MDRIPHMTIFQHAGFFPFEVFFIHKGIEFGLPWYGYFVILTAGIFYARYGGGFAADVYNDLPAERKIWFYRAPLVVALIIAPIGAAYFLECLFDIGFHIYKLFV